MLLKDVPGVLPRFENSLISKTDMWTAEVDTVIPAQFLAFRKIIKSDYPDVDIDRDINYLVRQVQFAELENVLTSPLRDYVEPNENFLLTSELKEGLQKLSQTYQHAFLFGMETHYSSFQIETMSYQQAIKVCPNTALATSIINSLIPSSRTINAFWKVENGQHVPLDDLESEVYRAFGKTWRELLSGYSRLITDEIDVDFVMYL